MMEKLTSAYGRAKNLHLAREDVLWMWSAYFCLPDLQLTIEDMLMM